jgi:trigger factor
MEIKSNKINSANAEITATIPMAQVTKNTDKIAKDLAKTANIQGFRKGKAPIALIKKQYGSKLVEDAEGQALRDVLSQGLKELNISNEQLIGEPQISKFDKSDDKIEVVVKIACRPEINMEGYAELVEEFDKPAVSDEEVEARIKEIAESQAELIVVDEDRALVSGDTVLMDFEGSMDGKLFDGGSASDFSLLLGSGQFIPGFEDQVIGMKKDEVKTIKVTFPEAYGSAQLAGKDSEFKVTVKAIQAKAPVVIDEDLAKKLLPGEADASVESLSALVKTQIENEKIAKLFSDELKPALLQLFVDKFEFDLPDFVVEQEIDMALNNKAREMSEDEIKALQENMDKLNELRETLREEASKSVKATFIIDALAKVENVNVTEQEVMQTIYYEAMQTGQDPQKAYEHYKNSGYLPAIQMSMVEDKVLSSLLNAKMKKA